MSVKSKSLLILELLVYFRTILEVLIIKIIIGEWESYNLTVSYSSL